MYLRLWCKTKDGKEICSLTLPTMLLILHSQLDVHEHNIIRFLCLASHEDKEDRDMKGGPCIAY